ncbi:hypothetical protein DXD47_01095 [Phocaeicola dorei]|nr:hypothetical protein DXD47_01095 [Phocaeicola dorei]RGO13673.1 hypothetical protein DXB29_02800 [Bacteroides sp. 3_1_33FAA]
MCIFLIINSICLFGVLLLRDPHFFYSNTFIFKTNPRKQKKGYINSFSALIERTNDKTQKRPLTIKIESDR